ncbi:hypothetical protein T4D_3810 [Trichinella pseudospiralis]|uniref:Uncharacterized protein n=1 Tax=Trichinella pseudospiralis TaxID=6337 RepID=A0A0V1DN68_TRIPS|nr:hypothetical protein T4D_3810 [Trichinella pseudospiralis]
MLVASSTLFFFILHVYYGLLRVYVFVVLKCFQK